MAVCRLCQREMLTAVGCKKVPITHHGKKYDPIKVGDEGDFFEDMEYGRCGDCGAKPGHYHHPGCDCERCPVCGDQLISCHCEDAVNSYILIAEKTTIPPKDLEDAIALASQNLSAIAYVDKAMKDAGDIWYRFIRIPVETGYAIYQVRHVTKAYVDLVACFLTGYEQPNAGWSYADFKYDRLVPSWGSCARAPRGKVEKVLSMQDASGLDWEQIRKDVLGGC